MAILHICLTIIHFQYQTYVLTSQGDVSLNATKQILKKTIEGYLNPFDLIRF